MRRHFDTVVVGGGPAGALTAYWLAKAGLSTIVFDATRFPREKACGGGLQVRTLTELPFDVSHLLRSAMRRTCFSFGLGDSWTRTYPEPLVHGILRREFDAFLLGQAEAAGAVIRDGTRVQAIERANGSGVSVRSEAGEFTAAIAVGADGANSIVSRHLNARENFFWQTAVYAEIPREYLRAEAIDGAAMRIDWGTLPSGYAWMFPKTEYVNVGAGGPVSVAKLLRPYVRKFVQEVGVLTPEAASRVEFRGHHLPTLTRRTRVAGGPILLVGDAAGLVEPLTGDGISFACHSAKLAAECIVPALASGRPELSAYERNLWSQIGRELILSRKVLALTVAFPNFVHRLVRGSDVIWPTFCRILRGEESFQKLKAELLGPFGFAARIVDLITHRRERKALCRGVLSGLMRQFST